ncbi:hypothetical protein ACFQUU_08470 [Herbaspirillum sp. GCM10030257]|uniref:hypothetical protein n=1 Tax=Herbaspirillum sp. GCM10030257 TaxID=3273393 RepID=UPI00360E8180
MSSSEAAVLQLCPADAQATQNAHANTVRLPDGKVMHLSVTASAAPGCRSVTLPVGIEEIVAVRPISSDMASGLGDTVLLQGPEREGRFTISSVSGTAAPAKPGLTLMPLRENLLAGMSVRTFGVEERIQARKANGRLYLDCRAGNKPAGVILSAPWTMSRARAELLVSAKGTGRYEVQVQDAHAAAKGTATTLGQFNATPSRQSSGFAVPDSGFEREKWQSFSIACPRDKAELEIDVMQLIPRAGPTVATGRSTWVWKPADWQQRSEAVLTHARTHGIKTLFISVPVTNGAVTDPVRLASFTQAAGREGVEVWSVDGDPRMVLPSEHPAAAARVRAYVSYNNAVAADARLRGMQLDVEHYLIDGYETAAAELDRRYLELARTLNKVASGMPLEFVVPFWWADKSELLAGVAPFAAGLTVMDYRTDERQILRFGIPFLDWASKYGKRVRIALEAGPIEAEVQRRYGKSSTGELWLLQLGETELMKQTPVLVLFKQPQSLPAGRGFRFLSSSVIDGSATTFHRNPDRMLDLLPTLESDFSAWSGFAGMALHELK